VGKLSQAIAEGDGISILVQADDAAAAGSAESQGADGLVARSGAEAVRAASQLPLLHLGGLPEASGAAADGVVVDVGLECVVRVSDEDELEQALEELDPEIFLLSPSPEGEEDVLEALLQLLHDVPAGKLAIAELHDASAHDVAELERAGVDAVLVAADDVAALVPAEPPDV
jgi:indole-3-glycerol phosphate synthase